MRILDIIQTAASNLMRNKTRSTLTIIAIFVGATTITLTNGIGDGIKGYLSNQIGSMGADNVLIVSQKTSDSGDEDGPQKYDPNKIKAQMSGQHKPIGGEGEPGSSPFMMSEKDLDAVKATNNITSVTPFQNLTADYITTGGDKYMVDTVPLRTESLTYDIAAGKTINNDTTDYEVLLPSVFVEPLGFSSNDDALGRTITLAISNQSNQTKEFDAKIVGVVNKSFFAFDSLILNRAFSNDTLEYQEIGKTAQQQSLYSAFFAEFKPDLSEGQVETLKDDLDEKGLKAVTIKDQQKIIFATIDAVVVILNIFGVVALTAASFGIINTLFMAVQERTKEIGLMKAVGMSSGKIFALFSIEATLLGLFGSLLGVAVASVLGRIANDIASEGFLKDFEGLTLLSFRWQSIAIIVLIITFIAFLAGTLPARKASKLDPIEALRYE